MSPSKPCASHRLRCARSSSSATSAMPTSAKPSSCAQRLICAGSSSVAGAGDTGPYTEAMGEQPPRFYSSAQVRELDRRAIEDYSIPAYTLMQRAASAAWKLLRERWPKARAIHVVAGPGNNGGDGYEVARLAKAAGIDARVWQIGPIGSGAASQAAGAWRSDGGATGDYSQGCLADAHVIVDSLLGIGVTRPVDGVYAAAVDEINARHAAGA